MQKSKKSKSLEKSDLLKRKPEEKSNLCGETDEALIALLMNGVDGKAERFGADEMFKLMEGLLVLPAKFIVIDGEEGGENVFKSKSLYWVGFTNKKEKVEKIDIDKILLAADAAVFFGNDERIRNKLIEFGVIAICDKRFVKEEYDPLSEQGIDFCYEKKSVWGIFAAIVKVLETYKFKFDWNFIVGKIIRK